MRKPRGALCALVYLPLLCPPARTTDDAIGAGSEMIEIGKIVVPLRVLEAVVDIGIVGEEEIVVLEVQLGTEIGGVCHFYYCYAYST